MNPMTDIPTDEMIEAGVAAFNQTETLSVRRLLRVAYPAMRATDPSLKKCVEALEASDSCLQELLATVEGECPSLLDEDSGGSACLSMAIDEALLKSAVALGKCPSCRSPREWVPSDHPPRPCKAPQEHIPQDSWAADARAAFDATLAAMTKGEE